MASIPIHNETDYTLTDDMTQHIIRDAQDHFGEEVHAIRVQSGLARHAFNARTREVRYAFSPPGLWLGSYHAPRPGAASLTASVTSQRGGDRGSDPPSTLRGRCDGCGGHR